MMLKGRQLQFHDGSAQCSCCPRGFGLLSRRSVDGCGCCVLEHLTDRLRGRESESLLECHFCIGFCPVFRKLTGQFSSS